MGSSLTIPILPSERTASRRVYSLTPSHHTYLPVTQHSSLLQAEQDRLEQVRTIGGLLAVSKQVHAVAQEPVGSSLQRGNMIMEFLAGSGVVEEAEDSLSITSSLHTYIQHILSIADIMQGEAGMPTTNQGVHSNSHRVLQEPGPGHLHREMR